MPGTTSEDGYAGNGVFVSPHLVYRQAHGQGGRIGLGSNTVLVVGGDCESVGVVGRFIAVVDGVRGITSGQSNQSGCHEEKKDRAQQLPVSLTRTAKSCDHNEGQRKQKRIQNPRMRVAGSGSGAIGRGASSADRERGSCCCSVGYHYRRRIEGAHRRWFN